MSAAMPLPMPIHPPQTCEPMQPGAARFYRDVLRLLNRHGIPFLVGGAYALNHYTGIGRQTKDLDLFIMRRDFDRVAAALAGEGYQAELTYPHWLGKAFDGTAFVDLIFSSGNGVSEVDDGWFDHAIDAVVLDTPVKLSPVEESIWSKAFIMERERYDGADIAHMIRACADTIDWRRLLQRFDPHWRVLLSHLTLFGFIYPAERHLVPAWLMEDLVERLRREIHAPPQDEGVCQGTLLSREQYLSDIHQQGFHDARVEPHGNMSPEDAASWTRAIPERDDEG
ncbi:Uncharacterised nucleotidyltransferase [Noviherbaspirillum humi]|uniref:Uncharacterized nucleotidyltransferase n=1 Tax=Noviherbaspirillum humi TaxID=1688639 RepID=A0A239L4B2_9BURK|nr:nucleotidyltransferase family protein [Noviherbaspirillum humi]SNT25165.1 Uncharacterised nucleotidyltransferase [Noviherbaspirillum humi]